MIDSADMEQTRLSDAAKRLAAALSALEGALDPLIAEHGALRTQARESEGFAEDRARLATRLDEALEANQTREADMKAREAEFETLSRQTRQELDAAISALQAALGDDAHG